MFTVGASNKDRWMSLVSTYFIKSIGKQGSEFDLLLKVAVSKMYYRGLEMALPIHVYVCFVTKPKTQAFKKN